MTPDQAEKLIAYYVKSLRTHTKSLSWQGILDQIQNDRVGGLLSKALPLKEAAVFFIPEDVRNEFVGIYHKTLARNLLVLHGMDLLIEDMKAQRIEYIILKGLVLADTVYGDIGVRPLSDIDLLIKLSDLSRMDNLLKSSGYALTVDVRSLDAAKANNYRNSVVYTKPGHVNIHVHWHIVNFFLYDRAILDKIDMDALWQDAAWFRLGACDVRAFSDCHQLIYLCMHGMWHQFKPLILLCDINELLLAKKDTLDWDKVLKDSVNFGLYKYVYYGLLLAHKTLGTEVPAGVLTELKPRKISFFETKFVKSMLSGNRLIAMESLVNLGMNESFVARINFIVRVLFPTREEMALIRHKDVGKVRYFDYAHRFGSAIWCGCKSIKAFR